MNSGVSSHLFFTSSRREGGRGEGRREGGRRKGLFTVLARRTPIFPNSPLPTNKSSKFESIIR